MAQHIIVITGGIGSGKSVVSHVLRAMQRPVYDCDARAKQLMDTSPAIRHQLTERLGSDIYRPDGTLHRRRLAAIIFDSDDALRLVNSVVHPAVGRDIRQWAQRQNGHTVWVETAIARESGIDRLATRAWDVQAPLEVRVARVMRRDGCTREQVLARIAAQQCHAPFACPVTPLVNDGLTPLLPQLLPLL